MFRNIQPPKIKYLTKYGFELKSHTIELRLPNLEFPSDLTKLAKVIEEWADEMREVAEDTMY